MCGGGTSPRWPACWRWLIPTGGGGFQKRPPGAAPPSQPTGRCRCFGPGPSAMTNRLVNNFSLNSGTCWSLCLCWDGDTGKQNRQNKSTNNLCNNSRRCQVSAREKRDKKTGGRIPDKVNMGLVSNMIAKSPRIKWASSTSCIYNMRVNTFFFFLGVVKCHSVRL